MNRFLVECYVDNIVFFYKEFKSITSVAEFIDCFINTKDLNIWFNVEDIIKDRSISVKELMSIWRS